MDKQTISAAARVVGSLVSSGARQATKYMSEKFVVSATRRVYRGKIQRGNIDITLKIGRPNYEQREFIRKCKKAGVSFPVGPAVLKPLPQKRK